jgi:hypothetical protein
MQDAMNALPAGIILRTVIDGPLTLVLQRTNYTDTSSALQWVKTALHAQGALHATVVGCLCLLFC